MILAIGLGNPGKKYALTRHNVGFHVLDAYAAKKGLYFNEQKLLHSETALEGDTLLLAKPTTFVNEAGRAARQLLKQYEGSLVVIYDDITISLGDVKCSIGRGDGGHNGITSLIQQLGTKDFFRIRVGIRPVHEVLIPKIAPPNGFETFMLTPFAPFETDLKEQGIQKAMSIIESLPTLTIEEIMNSYN